MRTMLFYLCLPLIFGISLKRPFWGVAIYLSANIIRPEMLFWGGDTGVIIFKVSIGSTLLGFLIDKGSKTGPLTVREWWLALWVCLAMTISLLFTDFPSNPAAWAFLGDFYRLLIVCWLILGTLREKQQALQIIDILLLMTMLLSAWGWVQSFQGNERLEDMLGQVGESNMLAALGVLFLPLGVHKIFTAGKWWQKIFGLTATTLIAGMIVFTNSRGGFLGLAAGCLYLLLTSRKRIWLGICYFLVLLNVVPLLSGDYIARLNTINSKNPEQEYSAGSRQVLWQAGWLIFQDHPFFGVGILNFAKAKAAYRYYPELTQRFDQDLLNYSFSGYKVGHSTWFGQMFPEGGLFLAIPVFWLIIGFFWRARKLQWAGRPPTEETRPIHDTLLGLEAGLVGYCVSISFIDALLLPFLTVQIMLGAQIIRIIDAMPRNETAASPITHHRGGQNLMNVLPQRNL